MRVFITAEQILYGRPGSVEFCPFALAVRRGLRERAERLSQRMDYLVAPQVRYLIGGGGPYLKYGAGSYRLSKAAKRWVLDFDKGESVAPQQFIVKGL